MIDEQHICRYLCPSHFSVVNHHIIAEATVDLVNTLESSSWLLFYFKTQAYHWRIEGGPRGPCPPP